MSDTASEKGIPRITDSHLQVAEWAWLTQDKFVQRVEWEAINHVTQRAEILAVLRSLASGSYTLVPTDELESLIDFVDRKLPVGDLASVAIYNTLKGWLSPSTLDNTQDTGAQK